MGALSDAEVGSIVKELDLLGDDAILRVAAAFLSQRPSLKEALLTRLSTPIDFEVPNVQSAELAAKTDGVTLLYFTSWNRPCIHCRAANEKNKPWTQVPGIPLTASSIAEFPAKSEDGGWFAISFPSTSEVEFLMNDGKGSQWDKALDGANHQVSGAGLWTLRNGKLSKYSFRAGAGTGETADLFRTSTPEDLLVAPCGTGSAYELAKERGGIVVLYLSQWLSPHLHFRLGDNGRWTDVPGKLLQPSALAGYPASAGWRALHFPTANQLEFVPNNGGNEWDKAGQSNHKIMRPGAWKLENGRLDEITAATAAVQLPTAAVQLPTAQPTPPALPKPAAIHVETQLRSALANADAKPVSVKLAEQLLLDGIVLLYRTTWSSPHLHCRKTSDCQWTALPGLQLPKADPCISEELDSNLEGSLFAVHLPAAETLEFVINDGGPHFRWDKAVGGSNFSVPTAGVWLLLGGRLEKLQPPPPAPSGMSCTSTTQSSVSLTWSAAGRSVRSYCVFRNGQLVKTLAGGITRCTDNNLKADREFEYTVAALSTQGIQGELSEAITARTGPAGCPGKPQNLRVAFANGQGIKLEWTAPDDNGGAPITAYLVQRDTEPAVTVLVGKDDTKEMTWTDSDVTHGSSYKYSVAAVHLPSEKDLRDRVLADAAADDADVLKNIKESMNVGPSSAPLEAEAVDEMETGDCSADLREQLKSRGITVFYKSHWNSVCMHCCTRPELGWTSLPGIRLAESTTGAFPSDEEWFSVYFPFAKSLEFVMNDGGTAWDKAPGQQNYKAAMTGVLCLVNGQLHRVAAPPQAPTDLVGQAVDGSRVQLSWKAPQLAEGEAPISCYKIFRNGRRVHTTQGSKLCSFTDSNLFAFTDYEYSVAAVNNQDVAGPLTASTTVKTNVPGPPSEPRNLRATVNKQDGQLAVSLEWEPPADCGGAPVSSYEIFKDGVIVSVFEVTDAQLRGEAEECRPVAPEASTGVRWLRHSSSYSTLSWFKDALAWQDVDVASGEAHCYQVRAVQLGPERADDLKSGGLVQRCGSRFLDNVQPDVVGPESDPVDVRVVPFMDPPRLGEQKCVIMYQSFDWGSCKDKSWYTTLLGLLPELRSAGVNMMWLPPPSDSVDEHAYLPRKWYVLDNKYGSAEALQRLVTAMHEQEIVPMLDVVVNHRCASLQDSAGRWLKYEMPDWEGWAVCHDSPAVPGGTGAGVTGEPAQYAPSVDHSNPKVREDVNAFIHYMMHEIGFRALRFDFVKGYAPHFQRDYVRAAGSPFAVAENWNGDPNGLHEYVNQCQGCMAVYDFPLYYTLKRCIHANNFADLNCGGRLAGIAGRDPARAVTFVDNHDTYQLAIVGGAFGNNDQVLRAYALLLTHPGVPCVFHFDYSRSPHVRENLLKLCSIRRDAGIHSTSPLNICAASYGLYAAIIAGKVAVKLGTDDWSPGGGWKFACGGHEFAVWVRG
eukprot:TRINITY_DN73264_c0_g1_i1.p1 TRINITY_DN73264_c0_g1~~TRINITY_DN73264_c0_g1_i1.p1  ORF type:complete len:1497 (-),score=262.19 TRINITY_DN73264_c0_g1_i1:288-4631(-)